MAVHLWTVFLDSLKFYFQMFFKQIKIEDRKDEVYLRLCSSRCPAISSALLIPEGQKLLDLGSLMCSCLVPMLHVVGILRNYYFFGDFSPVLE